MGETGSKEEKMNTVVSDTGPIIHLSEINQYLTDDAEARLFASEFGYEVHGTLGVILWNLVDRHINEKQALDSISELRKSSIWLSEKIISHAINAVKEISNSRK